MPIMKRAKYYFIENILYVFLAIIMLSLPLWINIGGNMPWEFIFREWLKLTPFVIIFLFNNFFLAPKLLLRSRYISYIISCLTLLFLMMALTIFLEPYATPNNKKMIKTVELHPEESIFDRDRERKPPPPPHPFIPFGMFFIGLFIIGFNSGVKVFIRWADDKERYLEKERQFLDTELNFLKQQISPHFFMNTLNNIHALVDIDAEKAKNCIIKLSNMMRYLLYENNIDKVSVNKEISFLESYIELMKLRYDEDKLSINLSFSGDFSYVKIPSFLFLPLIENAFKHGISASERSFINVQIEERERQLIFKIVNSNYPKEKQSIDNISGIGLDNIKKRLELIYPDRYSFFIIEEKREFQITLTIPAV